MIIVDFLALRMPGMLNRLSISITYKQAGKKEIPISFAEAVDWQSQNLEPTVGMDVFSSEIILPGLWIYYSLTCIRMLQDSSRIREASRRPQLFFPFESPVLH